MKKYSQILTLATITLLLTGTVKADSNYVMLGVNKLNSFDSQTYKTASGVGDDHSKGDIGGDFVIGKNYTDKLSFELAYSQLNSELYKTKTSNGTTYYYGSNQISDLSNKSELLTIRAKIKHIVKKHGFYLGAGIGRLKTTATYTERMTNTTTSGTGYGYVYELMLGDRISINDRFFVDVGVVQAFQEKVAYTATGALNGAYSKSYGTSRFVLSIGSTF